MTARIVFTLKPDQLLSEILSPQHPHECMRCAFDSIDDVLASLEQPLPVPRQQIGDCRLIFCFVIVEKEAFYPGTCDQSSSEMSQADIRLVEAIGKGNRPDHHDPAERVEIQHCGIVYGTGRVVDVDIHTLGAGSSDIRNKVGRGPVIDARTVSKCLAGLVATAWHQRLKRRWTVFHLP